MRTPEAAPGSACGLSILEILVVLVIFGIGWFAVLPNLNLLNSGPSRNLDVERLNSFMANARAQAMRTHSIEQFTITPGERTIVWGEKKANLPGAVSRCLVNGRQYFDRVMEFRVYPGGFMDEVRITLDGGQVLSANTLAAEFTASP